MGYIEKEPIYDVYCIGRRWDALKRNEYATCSALVVVNISAPWAFLFGDVSVAQLEASMSGVVLGGVVEVVGSNLAGGKLFTESVGSVDSLHLSVFILYKWDALKRNQNTRDTTCTALVVVKISAIWTSFFEDVSVAQLVASMSGDVLGVVVEVVGSNLAGGKLFTASVGSVDLLYPSV